MGIDVSWKGWAALATFALQNGLAILLVRYSKLHDKPYSSQVVVLLQEGAVKLPTSMLMYAWECGGGLRACRSLADDLRQRPIEWLQLSVPALLYTVQNTMLYVGFANVEAAANRGIEDHRDGRPAPALPNHATPQSVCLMWAALALLRCC